MGSDFSTLQSLQLDAPPPKRHVVHIAGTPGVGKSTIKKTIENRLTADEQKRVVCIELDEFTNKSIFPLLDGMKDDQARAVFYKKRMNEFFEDTSEKYKDKDVIILVGLSGFMYYDRNRYAGWGMPPNCFAETALYSVYEEGTKNTLFYLHAEEKDVVAQGFTRDVKQVVSRDEAMILAGFRDIHFDPRFYADMYKCFDYQYTRIGSYRKVSQDDAYAYCMNLIRPAEFGTPMAFKTSEEKDEFKASRKRKLGELGDCCLDSEPLAKKARVIQDMQAQLEKDARIVKEAQEFVESKNSTGKWNTVIELKGNTFDRIKDIVASIPKDALLDDAFVLSKVSDAPLVKQLHLTIATDTTYPDQGLENRLLDSIGESMSIVPTTLVSVKGRFDETKEDGTKIAHECDMIRVNLDDSLGKIRKLSTEVVDYMGTGSQVSSDPHVTLAYLKRGRGRDFILSDNTMFGRVTFVELQLQVQLNNCLPVMVDELVFENDTTGEKTVRKMVDPISQSTSPEENCGYAGDPFGFGFWDDDSWF